MPDHTYFSSLIWQIADLLRGPYRPPQYERVMLPMTVLRRFDCVLAPTKPRVLSEYKRLAGGRIKGEALDRRLNKVAGERFHNRSDLDFAKLKGDPDNVDKHLASYVQGFSRNVREIFEFFEFENEIDRMRESNILYLVVSRFSDVDLHPRAVPNEQMGLVFENLIRRFNELANETAGDHFTPREVIRLMVNILFIEDDKLLATPGTVRKLLDPACGTGGMLAEAQNYLRGHHPAAKLFVYGQDYNRRAFATAASDMLMKDVDHNGTDDSVRFGDCLTDDQFAGETYDYFLTNPPFGVDWKKQRREVKQEHDQRGFDGRFGAGLPRVNDGSLLFLLHMWDKREPVRPAEHKHGSRLAIVFSGSPLFAGGAGSGESNIRRWIIENDWLEAIIALPEQMFYNTGIGTFIWIVTNRKAERRKGKIQLLDARDVWTAGGSEESQRSLGDKRRHLTGSQIDDIVRLYGQQADGETSRIFDNADFGYTRVTVERPLRLRYQMTLNDKARFLDACPHLLDDVQAIEREMGRDPDRNWDAVWDRISAVLHSRKSRWKAHERKIFRSVFTQKDPDAEPVASPGRSSGYEPDPSLRDFESVPLKENIDDHFEREVRPHVRDAWMDRGKDKIGYEINFNRHFFKHTPPRPLEVIDAELKDSEASIMRLLRGSDRMNLSKPSRYPVKPLKHVVTLRRSRVAGVDCDRPYVGLEAIESWTGKLINDFATTDENPLARRNSTSLNNQFESGDVLFGKLRPYLAKAWVAEFPGRCTTELLVMRPVEVLSQYLCYVCLSVDFIAAVDASTFGSRMPRAEWDFIGSLHIPVPSLTEQSEIVAHLADQTSRLDDLFAATRRTTALLRERRAALIAEALGCRISVVSAP